MAPSTTDHLAPYARGIVRIVSALLFMAHGSQKILGFPTPAGPTPPLSSLPGIAGFFELIGGALLALGLFTRPVAFVLSGVMAFAYFIAHAPRSFFPLMNGGDAAVLYCFVFLYLAVAGAGAFSIDEGLHGRRPSGVLGGFRRSGVLR